MCFHIINTNESVPSVAGILKNQDGMAGAKRTPAANAFSKRKMQAELLI